MKFACFAKSLVVLLLPAWTTWFIFAMSSTPNLVMGVSSPYQKPQWLLHDERPIMEPKIPGIISSRQRNYPSFLTAFLESPMILSLSVFLALFYVTILNSAKDVRKERIEEKMESEEEESKELGLISKKLGIAREAITLVSESFNKAAHDLELVNVLHDIRAGDAETTPEGKKKTKIKKKIHKTSKTLIYSNSDHK